MDHHIYKELTEKVENTKAEAMAQFNKTGAAATDTLMARCLTIIERINRLPYIGKQPYLERCWDVYMWHQNNKMPSKLNEKYTPVINIEDDMDITDTNQVIASYNEAIHNSADAYSGGHGYTHINWQHMGHAKGDKINPYWNKRLAKVKHPVRTLEGQEKLDVIEEYKTRKCN
tara:strand:- start:2038 stop:2556 length:519 start_codon:yes stop_codon:yes gene_type:complete